MGARFRLADGALEALDFGKGSVLAAPLEPDFYRAPTDNEKNALSIIAGGISGDNHKHPGLENWARRFDSFYYGRRWENAWRQRRQTGLSCRGKDGGLHVDWRLKIPGFLGRVKWCFEFRPEGALAVSLSGIPLTALVRFGTRTQIPSRYRKVEWYGRGPQPCYCDRKAGAMVGLYSMDADELFYNYLKPQESGNRTDVRRVSFSDGGTFVVFRSFPGRYLNFSAGFASREAVEKAAHTHEIERSENLHVHIDGGQRGVGGSIPGVLHLMNKYRMKPLRPYSLSFIMERQAVDNVIWRKK